MAAPVFLKPTPAETLVEGTAALVGSAKGVGRLKPPDAMIGAN
jgi:hypothetical protein